MKLLDYSISAILALLVWVYSFLLGFLFLIPPFSWIIFSYLILIGVMFFIATISLFMKFSKIGE